MFLWRFLFCGVTHPMWQRIDASVCNYVMSIVYSFVLRQFASSISCEIVNVLVAEVPEIVNTFV